MSRSGKDGKAMTTLLQEFEEWLRSQDDFYADSSMSVGIHISRAFAKLEELKKKYNVTNSNT